MHNNLHAPPKNGIVCSGEKNWSSASFLLFAQQQLALPLVGMFKVTMMIRMMIYMIASYHGSNPLKSLSIKRYSWQVVISMEYIIQLIFSSPFLILHLASRRATGRNTVF